MPFGANPTKQKPNWTLIIFYAACNLIFYSEPPRTFNNFFNLDVSGILSHFPADFPRKIYIDAFPTVRRELEGSENSLSNFTKEIIIKAILSHEENLPLPPPDFFPFSFLPSIFPFILLLWRLFFSTPKA